MNYELQIKTDFIKYHMTWVTNQHHKNAHDKFELIFKALNVY